MKGAVTVLTCAIEGVTARRNALVHARGGWAGALLSRAFLMFPSRNGNHHELRALPFPSAPALDGGPPVDAEGYLALVRHLSRQVPDVMVAAAAHAPPAPVPTPVPVPVPASAWADATLASFATLRASLRLCADAADRSRNLAGAPRPRTALARTLSRADAAAWRSLCFGLPCAVLLPPPPPPPPPSFGAHVWGDPTDGCDACWEGGEEEEEEGAWEECDDDDDEGGGGAIDEGGGGGHQETAGVDEVSAHPAPGATSPARTTSGTAPLLSTLLALDQVAVVHALAGAARSLRESAPAPPHPDAERAAFSLAEAAWLHALLAALDTPLLASSAAVVRELFTALRNLRRRLLGVGGSPLVVAVEALCIIAGTSFGQALPDEML